MSKVIIGASKVIITEGSGGRLFVNLHHRLNVFPDRYSKNYGRIIIQEASERNTLTPGEYALVDLDTVRELREWMEWAHKEMGNEMPLNKSHAWGQALLAKLPDTADKPEVE